MNCKALYFAPALFAVFLFMACSKENQANNKPGAELSGSWEWERTDGGIAAHIHHSPQTTGKNIELQFAGNRYFVYTNGILSSEGTYALKSRTCIHDYAEKSFIDFSSAADPDLMIESQDGLTLVLSDEAFDGVSSRYKRKVTGY